MTPDFKLETIKVFTGPVDSPPCLRLVHICPKTFLFSLKSSLSKRLTKCPAKPPCGAQTSLHFFFGEKIRKIPNHKRNWWKSHAAAFFRPVSKAWTTPGFGRPSRAQSLRPPGFCLIFNIVPHLQKTTVIFLIFPYQNSLSFTKRKTLCCKQITKYKSSQKIQCLLGGIFFCVKSGGGHPKPGAAEACNTAQSGLNSRHFRHRKQTFPWN